MLLPLIPENIHACNRPRYLLGRINKRLNLLDNGLSTQNKVQDVQLYPNPATGFVTAVFPDASQKQVKVSDMAGRVVFVKSVEHNTLTIDLSGFSRGVYFVAITSASDVKVSKLVKE